MLRSWVLVVAALLVGPRLLKLLNHVLVRVRLRRLPLVLGRYEPVNEEAVPPSTRSGFEAAAGELGALGFVAVGYTREAALLPEMPRYFAVFWHPVARVFATMQYRPISPPLGLAVDFVTLFEEDTWLWTVRGRRHMFITELASGRLVDTLEADLAERLRLHLAAVAEDGRSPRAADLGDLSAFQSAREEEEYRLGIEQGQVVATADPRSFRFTAAGAQNIQRRQEEGGRRVLGFTGSGEAAFANIPPDELERHYRMAARFEELTRGPAWPIFALSAVAFAASMGLMGGWSLVAWLIPVLLFHELGHWAALRLLGHGDAWIAFIPFFGAATISKKRFDRLSHELIVLLAGPIPGIILALGLLFLDIVLRFNKPGLLHLAALLIGINILNLLPVHPLDGGRILHALVTAGRPRLGLVLKGVAAGAFVLAAVSFRDPMTALLAVFSIYAVWQEAKLVRVEAAIRRASGFAQSTTAEARRRFIFAALRGRPEGAPARWLSSVRQLEVPLSHAKSRHWWTIAAGVAYLGAFAVGGVTIARSGAMRTAPLTCPTRDRAIALSCANPTLAPHDWEKLSSTSSRPWRHRRASPSPLPRAAFVWCELADDEARSDLLDRLEEASPVDAVEDCNLPWAPPANAARDAPARCALLGVTNVAGPTRARAEAAGPAEGSAAVPGSLLPPRTIRFSVRFRDLDDFAPIGPYLCGLGCRVDVLPAAPDDRRVDVCF